MLQWSSQSPDNNLIWILLHTTLSELKNILKKRPNSSTALWDADKVIQKMILPVVALQVAELWGNFSFGSHFHKTVKTVTPQL